MLETMRNAAKTWVAKLLMGLLVLSFSVWGITDMFSGVVRGFFSQDLASVGKTVISGPQYVTQLERARKNLAQQSGQNITLDQVHKMGIDKQVLDRMIEGAVVDNATEQLTLGLSPRTIMGDVFANKAFQDSTGKFDAALFKRVLAQNGLSEEGFIASQQQSLLRGAVTETASAQFKAPSSFNQAIMQYQGESRDVKYFVVTASEADVAQPSDADLKAQYEKTPAAYTAPEYRSVVIMKVDPSDISARTQVSADEISAYYEQHKSEYYQPEKRTILQIPFKDEASAAAAKVRLDKGEDFVKIAAETGLKEADYTLPNKVKSDFLDPKIANAAFSLKEGEVSGPVVGGLATALLKIMKVSPEKQPALAEIKDQVAKQVQLAKAKDEIQSIFAAVEDARAQQTKFEDIAAKASIPVTVVTAVSAVGQDTTGKDIDLPAKTEVLKAVFSSDAGVENDALAIGDGYVWYDVRAVTPSAVKPLPTVLGQVNKDVIASRVSMAAVVKAKQLVEKANAGTALEALAKAANLEVKTATGLKRNVQTGEFDGQALGVAFSVPQNGFTSVAEGDGKSARVMQITKVTVPAIMAAPTPETASLQGQAKTGLMSDLQQSFVKALRQNAKVTINEELWRQNTGSSQASGQ